MTTTLTIRSKWITRLAPAIIVTGLLVLTMVLNPAFSKVYASNVFGSLRAPGEPAFVAGHRGDRASAPENTLPALERVLESEMEFVETDVQLTKDGVPILMHDDTVDRTTNGKGAVADLTWKKIKKLDAGSWFSKKFAKTRVPSLDQFLEVFAPADKKLLLELKGFWDEADVQLVVDLIRERGVERRVTLASFDFTTVMNIEKIGPSFPRVIIMRDLPADPVGLANHFGAIAILTSPASLENDPGAVEAMHEAGLGVLLYTLNNEERWSEALAFGVDGIITDKPSDLDEWLAATAPGT
jgi:glycerophosphoryl diester phosphodiesterase